MFKKLTELLRSNEKMDENLHFTLTARILYGPADSLINGSNRTKLRKYAKVNYWKLTVIKFNCMLKLLTCAILYSLKKNCFDI